MSFGRHIWGYLARPRASAPVPRVLDLDERDLWHVNDDLDVAPQYVDVEAELLNQEGGIALADPAPQPDEPAAAAPVAARDADGELRSMHACTAWRVMVLASRLSRRQDVASHVRRNRQRWADLISRVRRADRAATMRERLTQTRTPPKPPGIDLDRGEGWCPGDLLPSWIRRFGHESGETVAAGRVTAAFLTLSHDEQPEERVRYRARLRDLVCSWLGGSHATRHRACNRWADRMRLLRGFREELLFDSVTERRSRTPVNEAWVAVCARKLVTAKVEEGIIDRRHARWFKDALVTVFFIRDRDDEFMERLATVPVDRFD